MIVVLGSVIVKAGHLDEALEVSQQHVNHSRTEPGCIEHGVHLDCENSKRLVFVEKWADQAALSQHFKEATSIAFIQKIKSFAQDAPELTIYAATQLDQ